ncbi:MAG: hypothetical protein EA397_04470 [Deltaproteobacteria bacterium]|nr:MAG: hypothetical protein EA397_04470 [Deltaproteobacteria bacterium]
MRRAAFIAMALLGPVSAGSSEVQIFGEETFVLPAPSIALLVRSDGGVCSVDVGGMICFDSEGVPEWDLDLPGYQVFDVVVGADEVALLTAEATLIMSLSGGEALLLSPDVLVTPRADGILTYAGEEAGFPLPEGFALVEAIATLDGRLGLFDEAGDLLWLSVDGEVLGVKELGLSGYGGLRALPLGDGFAVVDDDGVIFLDDQGEPKAAAELLVYDIAAFDGGVMVADGEGVVRISAATGEIEAIEVEADAWRVGVSFDGERLAVAGLDIGRMLVWQGSRQLGGVGHRAEVVSIRPARDGGALTVDADGLAIRWRSDGSGQVVSEQVIAATLDGQGGSWFALPDQLVWVRDGMVRAWEVEIDDLLGVHDGVVLRSDDVIERWTIEGELVWSTVAPAGALAVFDEVLTVASGDELWVLDLGSGQRRRRIVSPQDQIAAGGVSTGGLVAMGWRGALPVYGRPPKLETARGLAAMRRGPSLSPNGRWALWSNDEERFVLSDLKGGLAMTAGATGEIRALATDDSHAWLGLHDGRVERWDVTARIQDAPLAPFSAYAQLDVFTPFPTPTVPDIETSYGPIHGLLATGAGDLALLVGGLALRSTSGSTRVLMVEHGRPRVARWSDEHGVLAGYSDGRVFRRAQTEEAELLGTLGGPVVDMCGVGARVYVGTFDGLWFVEQGQAPRRARGAPSGIIEALECDPNGTWASALVEGEVHVWHQRTGQGLAVLRQGAPITAMGRSPKGELITGGADEVVIGWEPAKWSAVWTLEGHEAPITALATDRTGRVLVATAGERAVWWDVYAGKAQQVVELGEHTTGVARLPGSRFAVSGIQGRLVELGAEGRIEPLASGPPPANEAPEGVPLVVVPGAEAEASEQSPQE